MTPIARADDGATPVLFATHKERMVQIRTARFTPTQRLILAAASMFCGRTDRCFCSVERLAADVGCHAKTAGKLVAALTRQRLLAWADRGPGLSPWLVVDWARLPQYVPPPTKRRAKVAAPLERQGLLFESIESDADIEIAGIHAGGLTDSGCGVGETERPTPARFGLAVVMPTADTVGLSAAPQISPVANAEPSAPIPERIAPENRAVRSAPHTKVLRHEENKKAPTQTAFGVCVKFTESIGWNRAPTPAEIQSVDRLLTGLDAGRGQSSKPDRSKVAVDAARRTREKFAACKTIAGAIPYWTEAYNAAAAKIDRDAANVLERRQRAAEAAERERKFALERQAVDRWKDAWQRLDPDVQTAFRLRVIASTPALHALIGSAFVETFVVREFAAANGGGLC